MNSIIFNTYIFETKPYFIFWVDWCRSDKGWVSNRKGWARV